MSRIINSPESKLLAAIFDKYSIVKREQDGKYLARVDSIRQSEPAHVEAVVDSPWAALDFIRRERLDPSLDFREVSMDPQTFLEFEFPRH